MNIKCFLLSLTLLTLATSHFLAKTTPVQIKRSEFIKLLTHVANQLEITHYVHPADWDSCFDLNQDLKKEVKALRELLHKGPQGEVTEWLKEVSQQAIKVYSQIYIQWNTNCERMRESLPKYWGKVRAIIDDDNYVIGLLGRLFFGWPQYVSEWHNYQNDFNNKHYEKAGDDLGKLLKEVFLPTI